MAPSVSRRVVEDRSPEILADIFTPGCAVAIWRRELRGPFQNWLDALRPDQLPEAWLATSADRAGRILDSHINQHGISEGPFRTQLIDDAAMLARAFARTMKIASLRLRLDVICDGACRKFHLDNVSARLLCTYRGRGTQYGRHRIDADPNPIHELATADVGLFRGQLWPTAERTGIVHRSPPISELGETRLLLVIDDGGPEAGVA